MQTQCTIFLKTEIKNQVNHIQQILVHLVFRQMKLRIIFCLNCQNIQIFEYLLNFKMVKFNITVKHEAKHFTNES